MICFRAETECVWERNYGWLGVGHWAQVDRYCTSSLIFLRKEIVPNFVLQEEKSESQNHTQLSQGPKFVALSQQEAKEKQQASVRKDVAWCHQSRLMWLLFTVARLCLRDCFATTWEGRLSLFYCTKGRGENISYSFIGKLQPPQSR